MTKVRISKSQESLIIFESINLMIQKLESEKELPWSANMEYAEFRKYLYSLRAKYFKIYLTELQNNERGKWKPISKN